MAHYLAELYTPKPAWLALPDEDRQAFFASVAFGMPALTQRGVEPVAMGEIESAQLHPAPHTFFAIWRAPESAAIEALIAGIAATGWHDYFETLNASGEGVDLAKHLGQLAQAA